MTSHYLAPEASLQRVTLAAIRLARFGSERELWTSPRPLRQAAVALRQFGLDSPLTKRLLKEAAA